MLWEHSSLAAAQSWKTWCSSQRLVSFLCPPCLTLRSQTFPPTSIATRCSASCGGWTIAFAKGLASVRSEIHSLEGRQWTFACIPSVSCSHYVALHTLWYIMSHYDASFIAAVVMVMFRFESGEMTDIGDPFCSNIRVCLCLTDQCSLPPAPGSPICVCFNKKLAGGDGWSGQQLFDWSTSFGDTFWLYYIFCMGLGFSAPQANGRPLFAVQAKELCIKGGTKLAVPMEGGKLCSAVSTRLCFWDQCALPPAEGAPMFVCFNLLNQKGASAKPLAYGSWNDSEVVLGTTFYRFEHRSNCPAKGLLIQEEWGVWLVCLNLRSLSLAKGREQVAGRVLIRHQGSSHWAILPELIFAETQSLVGGFGDWDMFSVSQVWQLQETSCVPCWIGDHGGKKQNMFVWNAVFEQLHQSRQVFGLLGHNGAGKTYLGKPKCLGIFQISA